MTPLQLVSVSGGKDSTACAILARETYPSDDVDYVFADTGNEHDLTLQYVREYLPTVLGKKVAEVRANFDQRIEAKRNYVQSKWPDKGVPASVITQALEVLKPTGNPYLDLCLWKGRFPSRRAQFCTQELKTLPLTEYALVHMDDGREVVSWQGVRADESEWRASLAESEPVGGGLSIFRPILRWDVRRVVSHVRSYGVSLNPLYSMGFDRVGCMPCVNSAKDDIHNMAQRFPAEVERILEWERLVALASRRGAASFIPNPEKVQHYVSPDFRSVVVWAASSWGGRQSDWVRSSSPAACVSSYGLCE